MRFHPADAANYRECIVLGNGGQLDRLQAAFWNRLTEIQQKCSHAALTLGVNRLGCCEAAIKHGFMPDLHGVCDAPRRRPKPAAQLSAEAVARAEAEKKRAAIFRKAGPTAFEEYELMLAELERFRAAADAAKGAGPEMVLTPTSEVFMRSHARVAGVALRVVSDQARAYPHDMVLNTDRNLTGPPDRSIMIFTTVDWLMNWLVRQGFRGTFYLYGMGSGPQDGAHCRVPGFDEPDDYSWTLPSRQKNAVDAWQAFKDAYPDAKIRVTDRRSFLVTSRCFEFGLPECLDPKVEIPAEEPSLVLPSAAPEPPGIPMKLPDQPPPPVLAGITDEILKQDPKLLRCHAEVLARNLYRERYAGKVVSASPRPRAVQEVPCQPQPETAPQSPASTAPSSATPANEPCLSPCAAVS